MLAAAIALALFFSACSDDDEVADTSIRVFAAASLTESFTELGEAFEAANPDPDVEFNFAASSELVVQIQEGAPGDAFASADEAIMQTIVDADLHRSEPVVFARNRLAIAVEPGNPKDITGLADLADPDITVVLCAEQVPCGKYADQALAAADVTVTPVSRGESAKATLSVVELGEADAAIVYITDVRASAKVEGVEIPDDENVIATLPIATLLDTGAPDVADAWVEFVTSPEGLAILEEFGFLAP